MAIWNDGDWVKLVWNSGLQYKYSFSVRLPIEEAYEKTKRFYESRKCTVTADAGPERLELRRGTRWSSFFARAFGISETWLKQVVRLEFSGNDEFTEISADYDAEAGKTICTAPMRLAKEIRNLERLLKNGSRGRAGSSIVGFLIGLALGTLLAAGIGTGSIFYKATSSWDYPTIPDFSPLGDRLAGLELESDGEHDCYAVILNADDAERHTNNVSLAHATLVSNGYAPENVFVFSLQETAEPDGAEPEGPEAAEPEGQEDDESEDPAFLTHAPTYGNLDMFFDEFARNVIDDKDYLTVYVTGHGTHMGRRGKITVSKPGGYGTETLSEADFAVLLGGVQPAQTLFVFDQCHGNLNGVFPMDSFLVVSRTTITETGTCLAFAQRFFKALSPGEQGEKVSIGEAFDQTLRFDEDYREGHYTPTITGPLADSAHEVFLSK